MTDSDLQQKRLVAAAIDAALGVGIAIVFWTTDAAIASATGAAIGEATAGAVGYVQRLVSLIGATTGVAYVLLRDVLLNGRSLGKKMQGLHVVTSSGGPVGIPESARRNAIFALGPALAFVSALLGVVPCMGQALACLLFPLLILGGLATIALIATEIVKIVQDEDGIRFGDRFADTRVVAD
jgi:uncharacterized RDD family membrane protein YckC